MLLSLLEMEEENRSEGEEGKEAKLPGEEQKHPGKGESKLQKVSEKTSEDSSQAMPYRLCDEGKH